MAPNEVIAQINDLLSGDHPDSSVRNVVELHGAVKTVLRYISRVYL
jgi:hypothetical protein